MMSDWTSSVVTSATELTDDTVPGGHLNGSTTASTSLATTGVFEIYNDTGCSPLNGNPSLQNMAMKYPKL